MEKKTRGIMDGFSNINVGKITELLERLTAEETVQDVKTGIGHTLKAKDRFFAVVCRLMGKDEWIGAEDGSRAAPDPDMIEEKAIEEIAKHPLNYIS